MLRSSFFKIISADVGDGTVNAILEIDTGSDIFKGHFPGQPILPGACMLQIIKEVLAHALKVSISLKKADNLKFLSLIDPEKNNKLHLNLTYLMEGSIFKVTANLTTEENTCFKFQGAFINEAS